MNDKCSKCHRPYDPDLDLIENFLRHGAPAAPLSDTTKKDLLKEINKRDRLLNQLHSMFLRMFAKEFAIQAEAPLTEQQLDEPFRASDV